MTVKTIITVCSCHVTYAFQSESTLYSCLNVKELLAWSRHKIWSLSDCYWTRTQNLLVRKRTLNHFAKWLSVSLQTKWFWVRVQLHFLKTIMQPFLHYLRINSPPNKVVQTKNLVHYVLLRHLFFPTKIWNQNPSQSSLSSCMIFFEKLFISYYIFLFLEC